MAYSRGGVMVWGCMRESGVGELKLVVGRMCAKHYVSLLRGALPESVRSLGLEGDYIFQQDNASCNSGQIHDGSP